MAGEADQGPEQQPGEPQHDVTRDQDRDAETERRHSCDAAGVSTAGYTDTGMWSINSKYQITQHLHCYYIAQTVFEV